MQFTLKDYLDQLITDKETLVTNLLAKGVEASSEETFTTLVPKVNEITPVNNQSKSITITTNTTTDIEPDSGYTGLSSVSVTTNVSTDMSAYFNNELTPTSYDTTGSELLLSWTKLIKKIPDNITIASGNTSMSGSFRGFQGTELPYFDTTGITSFNRCFYCCNNLVTAPNYNTSSATDVGMMFYGCINLVNVPVYNLSHVTNSNNLKNTFQACSHLSNTSLDNILQICIGSRISGGIKTLANIGLSSAYYPATTIQGLPHYQDFIDAGWTIGY